MAASTKVDGTTVSIGDWVGFKSDVEQGGQIVAIKTGGFCGAELVLENKNGFDGGYIGGDTRTTVSARDCWAD